MNSRLEKLDRLITEAKTNAIAIDEFYEELWTEALSSPELHALAEKMDTFIKSQRPVQQKYLALSDLGIGYLMFHEGKYELSLIREAEAQKLFSELKEDGFYQCAAILTACDYRTLGEMELSLKILYDAWEYLSKTSEHMIFQGFCVYNLAEIYSETGQYDDALKFHTIGEKLMIEIGNQNMQSRVWNGIGCVYQHQKKYALALDYLTKALKLSEEINNPFIQARALTDLGSYYFEMGNYVQATSYQERALKIRTDLNIPNGRVTNMINLANVLIKQNKPDEAIAMLNNALRIAEEVKVKPKMFQIHQMLSDIYQSKGDLVQSLFHYKAFHQIREEVQHEDNEKKIKTQKLIFEAEQIQKENVIIKKQKEEIQHKNIELQDTIDELTITKVSRRAKVLTLAAAVILFIFEDPIVGEGLKLLNNVPNKDSYYLPLLVKMVIIFSLSPINITIQNYLLKRVIKRKKRQELLAYEGSIPAN